METVAKCKLCCKEYNNYMRTYYIEKDNKITCACKECCTSVLNNHLYYYYNHIPSFCDGGEIIYEIFDNKEQLLNKVFKLHSTNDHIITQGNDFQIVRISRKRKLWLVFGYASCRIDLPSFDSVLEEYTKIWEEKE